LRGVLQVSRRNKEFGEGLGSLEPQTAASRSRR
jgi:hypothetical protein